MVRAYSDLCSDWWLTADNLHLALEGAMETLAKELDPAWNIKVRPATIATVPAHETSGWYYM